LSDNNSIRCRTPIPFHESFIYYTSVRTGIRSEIPSNFNQIRVEIIRPSESPSACCSEALSGSGLINLDEELLLCLDAITTLGILRGLAVLGQVSCDTSPIAAAVCDIGAELVDEGRVASCVCHPDIVDKVGASGADGN